MKIGGVTVTPNEEILVLPRIGDDIVIKAVAVDMDEYEEMYPKPTPPKRIVQGGVEEHTDAPAFKEAMVRWGEQRFQYMVLQSLAPSQIEWETVDLDNPATWKNWTKELQAAGFASTECNRIINCVLSANSLNEAKLKAAREAFLHGQEIEQARSSGRSTEQPSTPSGTPANDSE